MKLPDFFGLDIGNSSIKIAQIKSNMGGFELIALGQSPIEKQLTILKDETEKKNFVEGLKTLKLASGVRTNKVVIALPESSIFSKIITVPDLTDDQLEKVIFFEARNYLPVPVEDVQLDYVPINKKTIEGGKKILQILLIAAPKTLVNMYLELAGMAGLDVLALETESIASARALSLNGAISHAAIVVDFGSKCIAVSIIRGKDTIFSQSIGTGSDALTSAIARDYNLDIKQAEQYKRTYGLLSDQLEGRIAKSLIPVMQIINNELNKVINFIKINLSEFAPSEIYLGGEGALLPGLVSFFNLNLGLPVKIVNPFIGLQINGQIKSDVQKFSPPAFTVALGLALKTE